MDNADAAGAGEAAARRGVARHVRTRRCESGSVALSVGVGGVTGPWLAPPRFVASLFWRDTDGASQVDARPFAGHGRVQRSLLEELLDGWIADVWFAFACPNWAPLKISRFLG